MTTGIRLTRRNGYVLTDKDTERFWSKVDIRGANDCWNWKAALNENGYGVFGVGGHHSTAYLAHRIAWTIANGRNPLPGLEIAHTPVVCHNRACCNPNHLSEKTSKENKVDMKLDGTTGHNSGERNGLVKHPESVRRGELAGKAKLTQADAERIRELRKQGIPQRVVAKMFSISSGQVSKIKTFAQWKEYPPR